MVKEQEKELYAFEVKTTKEVEEKTVSKDEKTGEETTITKKVKKEVPVRIVIKRPTRQQIDKAETQYTVKLSELMKLGVLTRAMVTKKYADTGGVLTDVEAQYLTSRYKRLAEIQKDFVNLSIKAENLSEEDKVKLDKVTEEINTIRREIAETESNYSFIFQHTADMKATNHVILWYSLMLSYVEEQKDGGQPTWTPFYKGDTFEEKLEDFYTKEENADSFYLQVKQKLAYFISFWYNGAIASKDDFTKLEKDINEGKI
jgi:hypothetical protein